MMKSMKNFALLTVIICITAVSIASAGTNVTSDITTPTNWTKANSPYHLKTQIYVQPGATLTIDAGVVVANFVPDQGSLAVCRGAKIYVNGTKDEPVIMTSAEDVNNWTGSVVTRTGGAITGITTLGDPKTGKWLERCNDWGNLTIMGDGLIAASHYGGVPRGSNTKCPTGLNVAQMEGLVGGIETYYGGADDDDDSGDIHYLSIRYGGKVVGLANELNGLSLGGIGRETDIHHVEIMNNVDDGIELWGGTVGLKYVSIWNIGDDSLDADQGWRGYAQYGLIVQGHSVNAAQGSGVGDNAIEVDGAEDSDAQPMTTVRIANFTMVGQPIDGDHGTAWRDNARVQYDNCIWMELGEHLVRNDNTDGDGAQGYGYNGTLSWANTWTTTYATWAASPTAQINLCGADLGTLYGQYMVNDPNKPLAYIRNSVFYRNLHASAYTEATSRGVFAASNNNVIDPCMPIQELQRSAPVVRGGKTMLPVVYINPCAASKASSRYNRGVSEAKELNYMPEIQPVSYAGAFSPYYNWLESWTATCAYGMTDTSMNTITDTTSTINPNDGDLDNDMDVDFSDFAKFAASWLTKG